MKDHYVNHTVGQQLLGSLLQLSRKKFSSNVIEKCLESTTAETKAMMVEEIMNGCDSFFEYLMDQYGNYVVQKALQVAVEPTFTLFLIKVKPDLVRLRNSNEIGLKVYNKLMKSYGPQLNELENYTAPAVTNSRVEFESQPAYNQSIGRTNPFYDSASNYSQQQPSLGDGNLRQLGGTDRNQKNRVEQHSKKSNK